MNWIVLWHGTIGTRPFFEFITFEICWIKPAANIPTINERTKANGRGRGRGDWPGIDGKWYYDSVEDECSVFLWSIDNVVRYRGYRGVSVHVDSGVGQENCAEIIRKIKVIMNDRRTQDGAQGVKEGNSCHRFFGAMSLRGEKYPFLSHPKRFFASTKWICPFNYSTMSAPSSSLHVRMGVMDQSLWHCALQMTRICHKYGPFKRTLSLQEMFTAGSRVLHSATTFTGAPVHFSQVRQTDGHWWSDSNINISGDHCVTPALVWEGLW